MPTYEELIETLVKKNTLPFSRVGIISSLVRLGDTRAIPHFIEALNDENHYVRREAARALGQLGSPEAAVVLLGVLENESDEETRRNALVALGNIGDERAVEPLKQWLRDPSYWIRRAAEMGLEQLQKRLGMQQAVAKNSLETSITEEAMNLGEMTSVAEVPMSTEEIPSYRELTDSISQESTVRPSNTAAEMTSTIPEMTTDESVSNEYGASIPPTSPRISDEQIVPPPQQARDTWRCNRCGDEVDSYYDVCQTCGGHKGETGGEKTSTEDADLEEWFRYASLLNLLFTAYFR